MTQKERLIEILSRYFQIGDSYAYNLTRDKAAFSVGTIILDDFEEFDDATVSDIADHLLANGVIVPKRIKGYEDYFIDEYGNVYSLKSRRYVSQQKHKDGYYYVGLCKNGKRKSFAVHRLVAMHFIENDNNFPQVNHIDENKENNNVNNLEWCTEKYNSNYGSARQRQAKKVSRAVVCIETGEVFLSQKQAGEKISVSWKHITDCCKNDRHTCGGYHWRYASCEEAEKALAETTDKNLQE